MDALPSRISSKIKSVNWDGEQNDVVPLLRKPRDIKDPIKTPSFGKKTAETNEQYIEGNMRINSRQI